jgi:predicted transcriptional regulator of viral defense system
MSSGISAEGRRQLAAVVAAAGRFIEPADAARALDLDSKTAAQKLSRWATQGWVRRVRRGLYIAVPVEASNPAAWSEDPLIVANRVWSPCYFTGWTAARHWGLTEQVFHTTVVRTAERVRIGHVRLLDHDYAVSHVTSDEMAWGLRNEWLGDVRLRFASPARTVVEVLDDPRLGGGPRHSAEILEQYLDEHDAEELIAAANQFANRAVFKRLGFLVERLGLDAPGLVDESLKRLSSGVSSLDPGGPIKGHVDRRWRLRVNAAVGAEGHS